MQDQVTITGVVGTEPNHLRTANGRDVTSFRLASTSRRYDQQGGRWVDGDTSWFTITSFGPLAENAERSVRKGQRLIVAGRLRVQEWKDDQGRRRDTVDIVAETLGHDLRWGSAEYVRSTRAQSSSSSGDVRGDAWPDGTESSGEDADLPF